MQLLDKLDFITVPKNKDKWIVALRSAPTKHLKNETEVSPLLHAQQPVRTAGWRAKTGSAIRLVAGGPGPEPGVEQDHELISGSLTQ